MTDTLTAGRIIELLGLKPHPTCGYVAETYRAQDRIMDEALPTAYGGSRPFASVLYFLVTPDAQIRLHRIRSDQMYHHYLGEPLDVLLLYPDGSSEVKVVGSDIAAGMRPQLLVPGGTFHAARITGEGSYSLLGTSVWLRAEPSDVELGNPAELAKACPAAAKQLAGMPASR